MKTFRTIREALAYTVNTLIAAGHTYIINVRGPSEIASNEAAAIQFVAQHMVYNDGKLGLTMNLPFDPASGEFAHLVQFVGAGVEQHFDEYYVNGIPSYALRLLTDIDLAKNVALFILSRVHGYKPSTQFECEVHDEGPLPSETQVTVDRVEMGIRTPRCEALAIDRPEVKEPSKSNSHSPAPSA
ncbi:MAG: hypothetical protein RIC55_22300 [Pirellulaceae bacterium]